MDKIHNISFTSRYNPIKPFTIRTKEGKIYVSEASVEKALTPKFVDKINRFIIKNMSEATNYEFYTKYKTGTLKERKEVEEICRAHLLEVFNDTKLKNNITLLLAKDSKNRFAFLGSSQKIVTFAAVNIFRSHNYGISSIQEPYTRRNHCRSP